MGFTACVRHRLPSAKLATSLRQRTRIRHPRSWNCCTFMVMDTRGFKHSGFLCVKTCWLRHPSAARRCSGEGRGGAGTKQRLCGVPALGCAVHHGGDALCPLTALLACPCSFVQKKKYKNTASSFRPASLGGHGNDGDALDLYRKGEEIGSYRTKEEIPRRKLQNRGKIRMALNVTTFHHCGKTRR